MVWAAALNKERRQEERETEVVMSAGVDVCEHTAVQLDTHTHIPSCMSDGAWLLLSEGLGRDRVSWTALAPPPPVAVADGSGWMLGMLGVLPVHPCCC